MAVVGEEAVPSFLISDDLMKGFIQEGWSLDVDGWGREEAAPLPLPTSSICRSCHAFIKVLQ